MVHIPHRECSGVQPRCLALCASAESSEEVYPELPAVCVVCRLELFAKYLHHEGGVGGRQEAARISSLIGHAAVQLENRTSSLLF